MARMRPAPRSRVPRGGPDGGLELTESIRADVPHNSAWGLLDICACMVDGHRILRPQRVLDSCARRSTPTRKATRDPYGCSPATRHDCGKEVRPILGRMSDSLWCVRARVTRNVEWNAWRRKAVPGIAVHLCLTRESSLPSSGR